MRGTARSADGRPFSLGPGGPARAPIGALLLHGFTGSPFEVRLLGDYLSAQGHAVEGPLLAGHVSTTAALAATRWPDWLASASEALERLKARSERVVVCGLSMGGLLTLELARRHGTDLAAICVLAPALFLTDSAIRFVEATRRLPFIQRAALPKIAGSDIADREMRRRNNRAQGDAWMPLSALDSLVALGQEVRSHLGEVRLPILLAHSRKDHTVPFACMEAVANGVGTPRKDVRQLILERSHHVITLDVERETVFRAVAGHIREYAVA